MRTFIRHPILFVPPTCGAVGIWITCVVTDTSGIAAMVIVAITTYASCIGLALWERREPLRRGKA